ncbi:MAG TPA: hypothetical protein VIX82_03845 [Solirubrobacteraceae bacterium]
MAGEALFIGWGAVVRGREKQALQVFQESIEYYGKLQQDARFERFDVLFLGPHGGDLNGFVVLYGERKALADIRFSDEFERLIARAAAIIDSLGVVPAYSGETLGRQVGIFQEVADEFGG